MLKTAWKILLLAQVRIFQKSVFVCNYIRRKTSNDCSSKLTLCTFWREPHIQTCWNLVQLFFGWFLTNLVWKFWKFWFLAILGAKKSQKIQYGRHFWPFSAPKIAKNQNFQNPQTRFVRSHPKNTCTKFQHVWMCGSLKKVHKVSFVVQPFEVFRLM